LAVAGRRAVRRRGGRAADRAHVSLDAAVFALYVQSELGLPATTDALALSTVLDYKRHLQSTDPATGRPRAQTATIAKQLSVLRGFARWLALDDEFAGVDARIQLVKAGRGDPPLPRALTA
jgi:hypothetical protein